MKGDPPFDMEREKREPTWGDPGWRRLHSGATAASVDVNHLHIKTDYIEHDLNVALPLDRLRELAAGGEIGSVADSHYSTMGYQGADTSVLENETAPEIAAAVQDEGVDLLLLAPV
jgi:D-proline reductase (dithiol) PrdB